MTVVFTILTIPLISGPDNVDPKLMGFADTELQGRVPTRNQIQTQKNRN